MRPSMINTGVYIVGAGQPQPVKVGSARDVEKRLKALQIGNPEELVLHHVVQAPTRLLLAVEAAAHREMAAKRRRGEWFDVSVDDAFRVVQRHATLVIERAMRRAKADGDLLDELISTGKVDLAAKAAVSSHRLMRSKNALATGRDEQWIIHRCGGEALDAFLRLVIYRESIDSIAKTLLERKRVTDLLVSAINALSDAYAFRREQELLRGIWAA